MEKFISLKELIKQAKKEGIDLGKGDPYNRLRYYTKMGWLPHMIRKVNDKGDIEGHYPAWVVETLKNIHQFKNDGTSNDQIEQKIKLQNNLKKTTLLITDKQNQKKLIIYIIVSVLILVLLNEFNILKIGNSKKNIIEKQSINTLNTNYILESGTALLPKNSKSIFVQTNNAKITNRVSITFKDNYSPASRYWVTYSDTQNGFTLETDAPVLNDSGFYWFISN